MVVGDAPHTDTAGKEKPALGGLFFYLMRRCDAPVTERAEEPAHDVWRGLGTHSIPCRLRLSLHADIRGALGGGLGGLIETRYVDRERASRDDHLRQRAGAVGVAAHGTISTDNQCRVDQANVTARC